MTDTFHIRVIQNTVPNDDRTDFIIASYGEVFVRLYILTPEVRLIVLVRELCKLKRKLTLDKAVMMVSLPEMYKEQLSYLQELRGEESHIQFRFYSKQSKEDHWCEWTTLSHHSCDTYREL